jgi:hypothetical protein
MCDWEVGLIELSVVCVAFGVGAGGEVSAREMRVPRSCWLRRFEVSGPIEFTRWSYLLFPASFLLTSFVLCSLRSECCALRLRTVVSACALLDECTRTTTCF